MLIDFNKQISDDFSNICKPLFDHFPVSAFVYMEHFNESDFFYLSSDFQWAQQFLAAPILQEIHQPTFLNAYNQQKTTSFLGTLQNTDDPIVSKLNIMGYMSYLMVYKKVDDCVKLSAFVSQDSLHSFDFLSKETEIIETFNFYIDDKINGLIDKNTRRSTTAKLLTPIDLEKKESRNKKNNPFLDDLKLSKIILEHKGSRISLSSREWECLKLLADGLRAKEVAAHLGISHRTVESYYINIRKKTGTVSSSEMINLCNNNRFF